jgi:hypothetical protein
MTLAKVISGSIFIFNELARALDAGAEAEVSAQFRQLTDGRLAALISAGSAPCAWSIRLQYLRQAAGRLGSTAQSSLEQLHR